MSNFLKKLFKSKKTMIIITVIALLFIAILAFFPKREEANISLGGELPSEINGSKVKDFSTYEPYGDDVLYSVKDELNRFSIVNSNGEVLFTTSDSIQYFRVISEDSLIYLAKVLNSKTNKYSTEVRVLNLDTKAQSVLHVAEDLCFDVAGNEVYILDKKTGVYKYGVIESLKEGKIDSNVSKIYSSKGKVFAVSTVSMNGSLVSNIYLLGENPKMIDTVNGKVYGVSVDFDNDNLLYYSYKPNKEPNMVTVSKYIDNRSLSSEGKKIYTNDNGVVYSIGNSYLSFDVDNKTVSMLNSDMDIVKEISKLSDNSIYSLIKEAPKGDSILFINNQYTIKRYKGV